MNKIRIDHLHYNNRKEKGIVCLAVWNIPR